MDEWKRADDDEEEEEDESDVPLETIIEESNFSILPRTLSQAIIPSLETIPEHASDIRFRRVITQNEQENSPSPDYSLNNTYTSDNAYQVAEPIEPVATSLQPQSMNQGFQQQTPGYPNRKSRTKNYVSSLEQQTNKQSEDRRRA